MKLIPLIGVVLIVLGILSFFVPVPHNEDHSVKIGDAKVGIQTQTSQKIPAAASVAILGAGVLALVLGARRN
ncbi:MAG TPA: hypothetical protein VMI10_14060 [Terriglobales bacterium]|nr:hypothetical protein [Terriglobales bacterium]